MGILKFIRNYFGYYYFLFGLSYVAIYELPFATSLLNPLLLVVGYSLILQRQRLDIVVSLILFSKSMNGFIVYHNETAYDIVNILCNVVPFVLYMAGVFVRRLPVTPLPVTLRSRKFAIAFFVLLTVGFLANLTTSYDLLTRRYLPFFMFMLFVLFCNRLRDFDASGMIRFFRSVFVAGLIMFFFTNYLGYTKLLLESDSVFSVAMPSNSYSVMYFNLVRNYGFIWDHRALAIVCYLFLLLAIAERPRYFKIDIAISAIMVLTTTSRGGMLTYFFIIAAYFFSIYRSRMVIALTALALLAAGLLYFSDAIFSADTIAFFRSFNPAENYNAITQRHVFADYAMEAFREKPLFGNGVGFLSSSTVDRNVVVDTVKVPFISDAYWYVLLAEMGIVGFVLYLLFLFELSSSVNLLSIALLAGVSLQLIGTDIPDMRFNYFAILMLIYYLNSRLQDRIWLTEKNRGEDQAVR
jgi:hypothetical protein